MDMPITNTAKKAPLGGRQVVVERDAPGVDMDAAAKALMRMVTGGDVMGYMRRVQEQAALRAATARVED